MSNILDIAVQMTGQRNNDDIQNSLIKTVFELFPPMEELHFYTVSPLHDQLTRTSVAQRIAQGDNTPGLHVDSTITRGITPDGALLSSLKQRGPTHEEMAQDQIRMCFPVIVNDTVSGLIAVHSGHYLDEGDNVLGSLVLLYSNFVGLIQEKDTDTLTGVLNRRAFDYQISRLTDTLANQSAATAGSDQHECHWLVLLDVDHFKKVNDNFGHIIGDEILILVARLLTENFRGTDEIFRYGGEEFAVLLGPSTRQDARNAVERFRQSVEDYPFPQVGRLTVSCGINPMDSYDHIASMIGRADQALYYAKEQGRNRVFEYRDLVDAGTIRAETNGGNDIELF